MPMKIHFRFSKVLEHDGRKVCCYVERPPRPKFTEDLATLFIPKEAIPHEPALLTATFEDGKQP